MNMTSFDKAYVKVIKAEGGYVNDSHDKGGETYLGISRRWHPNLKMWEYIDDVKETMPSANTNAKLTAILKKDTRIDEIVKSVYKKDYWDKLRCSEIVSQKIAEQLFDMGVNAGIAKATQIMCDVIGYKPPLNVPTDKFIQSINGYARKTNPYKR